MPTEQTAQGQGSHGTVYLPLTYRTGNCALPTTQIQYRTGKWTLYDSSGTVDNS